MWGGPCDLTFCRDVLHLFACVILKNLKHRGLVIVAREVHACEIACGDAELVLDVCDGLLHSVVGETFGREGGWVAHSDSFHSGCETGRLAPCPGRRSLLSPP